MSIRREGLPQANFLSTLRMMTFIFSYCSLRPFSGSTNWCFALFKLEWQLEHIFFSSMNLYLGKFLIALHKQFLQFFYKKIFLHKSLPLQRIKFRFVWMIRKMSNGINMIWHKIYSHNTADIFLLLPCAS